MLADGRRFRVLVIVDDFTRECLALVVDTSISGRRVARELDAIIADRKSVLKAVEATVFKLVGKIAVVKPNVPIKVNGVKGLSIQ